MTCDKTQIEYMSASSFLMHLKFEISQEILFSAFWKYYYKATRCYVILLSTYYHAY